ncbi:hypothetical protein [Streptomyces sp. CRN 30]|uniref:hypothetical protein n=1 Tax=Streptomyces sp. CRN 30 TaxID=3075613 RepID=UPI002A819224|nr:hypothetical protein [Streptomyces sp. CRN 30]
MKHLDPYALSHVIAMVWGLYSLLLVVTWNRWTAAEVPTTPKVLLWVAWLTLVGLMLYVRTAGGIW